MPSEFTCARCTALQRQPQYVPSVRCTRCGAVHSLLPDGHASVISPVMAPINAGPRESPWMPATTRPVTPGLYEFQFAHATLMLEWNGAHVLFAGRRVQCRTLIKWRGSWLT